MSSNATKTITFQLPDDAVPGDTLSLTVGGQEIELLVPAGTESGDTLQIQVAVQEGTTSTSNNAYLDDDGGCGGGGGGEGNKDDDDRHQRGQHHSTKQIDLGRDQILEVSTELPLDYKDSNQNNDDKTENDGTYAHPWRSSIEIARRWKDIFGRESDKLLSSPPPKRILEIGAGLGIMGMSFAITACCTIDGIFDNNSKDDTSKYTITLTDLPAAIPLLDYNIERNKHLFSTSTTMLDIHCRPLRWTLERSQEEGGDDCSNRWTTNEPPFDYIIGSDLLYNPENIPLLVATTKRLLHPTRGSVLLAVRWRKPELEREFFQEMSDIIDWSLLLPSSYYNYCNLSWEEFGNPSSPASNTYFHQTQIFVKGKQKSLADISEDDTQNRMTTDEYEAWDRSYIQFYMGNPKQQQQQQDQRKPTATQKND